MCPVVAGYGARNRIFGANGERLEQNLRRLGVPHDVKIYPDAGHSFMSHYEGLTAWLGGLGPLHAGHHEASAEDSWSRILAFFAEHLPPGHAVGDPDIVRIGGAGMSDRWMIRGLEFGNCNCAWGCPCQFNAPSTHGSCEAVVGGIVTEGHFNEVRLDGLRWVMLLQWPGEIADGDGTQQVIIDERADLDQREVLRRILHGESTAPGTTHFFVYNSTMSRVLETLYAPVHVEIDIAARRGRIEVPGLVESTGNPIIDPHSGQEHRVGISLPNGFEYTFAEVGSGTSRVRAGIQLDLTHTYGQFNELHVNQDGVIR